jgi:hypothetical protein
MYLLFHQILWNSTDKLFEVPKRKSQTNTDLVKTSMKASEETCMLQPQITLWNHNKHFMQFQRTILQTPPPQHQQPNKSSTSNKTQTQTNMYSHLTCPTHSPTYNKLTTHQWEVKQHFEAFKLSDWFAKQKPNTKIHKYSLVKINHHYKPPNSKRHFQHPWTMGEPKDEMWSHTHTHTHVKEEMAMCLVLPLSAKTNIPKTTQCALCT